jgi:hypothetical protein
MGLPLTLANSVDHPGRAGWVAGATVGSIIFGLVRLLRVSMSQPASSIAARAGIIIIRVMVIKFSVILFTLFHGQLTSINLFRASNTLLKTAKTQYTKNKPQRSQRPQRTT